jgi:IS5 family transposase
VNKTNALYPAFSGCSVDKGFHSPDNQNQLAQALERCTMPKKGKRNKAENESEYSAEFKHYKRKHSAVASAINALAVHGLDRCPDKGLDGFEK